MFLRSVASAPGWAVAVVFFLGAGPSVQAGPITDPTGDFLASFPVVAQAGGLDVVSANVSFNGTHFIFDATMAGPITPPAGVTWSYVFGLNRGAGTEQFVGGTPSVGAGVFFDSVAVIRTNGVNSAGMTDVLIAGNTIHGVMPASLFPSTGFLPQNYTWNLWPRSNQGGIAGNAAISDFAPNASNVGVTVIPEPASIALFSVLGIAGLGWRRFRTTT